MTEIERFWSHVEKDDGLLMPGISSRCWEWECSSNADRPYGQFNVHRGEQWVLVYPHRYSWELHEGKLASGLELHHICGNKICVNPRHLLPIVPKEHKKLHAVLRHCCTRGHPYDEDNPLVDRKGYRRCRQCADEARERYELRQEDKMDVEAS